MINIEESTKIARNTRFAVLGRALADAHRAGERTAPIMETLAILRHQEHQVTDKQVAFAGLARQIGDAAQAGNPTQDLLQRLADLRALELGPA